MNFLYFIILFFILVIRCNEVTDNKLSINIKFEENDRIQAEDKYYKVNSSSLNLRKEPSISSQIITSVKRNRLVFRENKYTKFDIVNGLSGNWIYVSTLEKNFGYVFDRFMTKAKLENLNFGRNSEDILSKCKVLTNDCLEKQSDFIYNNYNFIVKQGKSLRILSFDGKETILKDELEYEDSIVVYKPLELFFDDLRYIFIELSYYEGNSYILFDRKYHKIIRLYDIPILSPDNQYLLVVSSSVAYNPSGIQIVKLSDREPEIVFEIKNKWLPCLGSWTSNTEVKIHECILDQSFDLNNGILISEKNIKNINNKWILIP